MKFWSIHLPTLYFSIESKMQPPILKLVSVTHNVFEHHISLMLIVNLKIVWLIITNLIYSFQRRGISENIDYFMQQNTSQTHGDHQNQKLCEYGLVKLKTLEVTFDIVTSRKIHPFEGKSMIYPDDHRDFSEVLIFQDPYITHLPIVWPML